MSVTSTASKLFSILLALPSCTSTDRDDLAEIAFDRAINDAIVCGAERYSFRDNTRAREVAGGGRGA